MLPDGRSNLLGLLTLSIVDQSERIANSTLQKRLGVLVDGNDSYEQMTSKISGCLDSTKNSAPKSSPPLQHLTDKLFWHDK